MSNEIRTKGRNSNPAYLLFCRFRKVTEMVGHSLPNSHIAKVGREGVSEAGQLSGSILTPLKSFFPQWITSISPLLIVISPYL